MLTRIDLNKRIVPKFSNQTVPSEWYQMNSTKQIVLKDSIKRIVSIDPIEAIDNVDSTWHLDSSYYISSIGGSIAREWPKS